MQISPSILHHLTSQLSKVTGDQGDSPPLNVLSSQLHSCIATPTLSQKFLENTKMPKMAVQKHAL